MTLVLRKAGVAFSSSQDGHIEIQENHIATIKIETYIQISRSKYITEQSMKTCQSFKVVGRATSMYSTNDIIVKNIIFINTRIVLEFLPR